MRLWRYHRFDHPLVPAFIRRRQRHQVPRSLRPLGTSDRLQSVLHLPERRQPCGQPQYRLQHIGDQDQAKVKQTCDGNELCNLGRAERIGDVDPRYGTFKYTRVAYSCVDADGMIAEPTTIKTGKCAGNVGIIYLLNRDAIFVHCNCFHCGIGLYTVVVNMVKLNNKIIIIIIKHL